MPFKITNELLESGLMISEFKLNSNSPMEKGFTFSDEKTLIRTLSTGCYLYEIEVPSAEIYKSHVSPTQIAKGCDKTFKKYLTNDATGDKWISNAIIVGERRSLEEVSTFEHLHSQGVDLKGIGILIEAIGKRSVPVVKYLIKFHNKSSPISSNSIQILNAVVSSASRSMIKYVLRCIGDYSKMLDCIKDESFEEAGKKVKLSFLEFLDEEGFTIKYEWLIPGACSGNNMKLLRFIKDNHGIYDDNNGGDLDSYLDEALESGESSNEAALFMVKLGANSKKALYEASTKGNIKLVESLITAYKILHKRINHAMYLAGTEGHLEVVCYLVGLGADPKVDDSEVLRDAVANNYINLAMFLAENGADIHCNDDEPLRVAARNGSLVLVQRLVELGANVKAMRFQAIKLAFENDHVEVAEYLEGILEKSNEPSKKSDKSSKKPLKKPSKSPKKN